MARASKVTPTFEPNILVMMMNEDNDDRRGDIASLR